MAELSFVIQDPFSMDPIELEKMIIVRDLRRKHGYNQFELSFLLGQRDFYVRDIENPFATLQYSVPYNNYLMLIFNCGIERIVPAKLPLTEKAIHRVSIATDDDGKVIYLVEKLGSDGKWAEMKTFSEEPKDLLLNSPSKLSEEDVKEWLKKEFEKNFFREPKTALEILKASQKDLDGPVRPLHLASALKDYTARKKSPRLIKDSTETGRFVYVKE